MRAGPQTEDSNSAAAGAKNDASVPCENSMEGPSMATGAFHKKGPLEYTEGMRAAPTLENAGKGLRPGRQTVESNLAAERAKHNESVPYEASPEGPSMAMGVFHKKGPLE